MFHVHDTVADAWSPTPISPPAALQPYFRYRHVNQYHDRDLGVHVMYVSGSNDQTGKFLVYRH